MSKNKWSMDGKGSNQRPPDGQGLIDAGELVDSLDQAGAMYLQEVNNESLSVVARAAALGACNVIAALSSGLAKSEMIDGEDSFAVHYLSSLSCIKHFRPEWLTGK